MASSGRLEGMPRHYLNNLDRFRSLPSMEDALRSFRQPPVSELPSPTPPSTDAGPAFSLPAQASDRARSVAGGQQGQRQRTKVTIESDGTPVTTGNVEIGTREGTAQLPPVDGGAAPRPPGGYTPMPTPPLEPIPPPGGFTPMPNPPLEPIDKQAQMQSLVQRYFQAIRSGNQQDALRVYRILQLMSGTRSLNGSGISGPSNIDLYREALSGLRR